MEATKTDSVKVWSGETLYHRTGAGKERSVIFLHGSGPGVSAWSNWQFALPELGETYDCIAPDLHGFGKSEHPEDPPIGVSKWLDLWVEQVIGLLDALDVTTADMVGNSMGGGIALHLMHRHPERFGRVVLMGAVGAPFEITQGLQRGWGFYRDPSKELLARLVRDFVHDPASAGGDIESIAEDRWEAVMAEENRRSFEAMFPGSLQDQVDDLVLPEAAIKELPHTTLITHGREDIYIPLNNSIYLLERIPKAQLHVFDHCGHWIQIEKRNVFNRLLGEFFAGSLD